MTQEQEELFRADPLIKLLLETEGISTVKLIGGAVLDILQGKTPKDYDFALGYFPDPKKFEMDYQYETKTAKTFKKGEMVLQQLKTLPEDFDFKISQATLEVNYKKVMSLTIDKTSFEKKILIPTDKAWTEKRNALNSLRRIPHWRNKGYTINDTTYLSLLGVVGKSNNINS
jgi:hypothetical protein